MALFYGKVFWCRAASVLKELPRRQLAMPRPTPWRTLPPIWPLDR